MGKMSLLVELAALKAAYLKLREAGPTPDRKLWLECDKACLIPPGPLPWEQRSKQ